MTATKKAAKSTSAATKKTARFSADERAAMKERNKELKAVAAAADAESALLTKIAEMQDSDRVMAEKIHAIAQASAPDLAPTTWYGQPAYAKNGKIVCFFQPAAKFKTRYATLGFSDVATLDDGSMWPASYALTKLTKADEKKIAELIKKAAG